MQTGEGRSQAPDPFREAMRSLIRGPDRAGALVFLLMIGWLVVIPGCAVLGLVSLFFGSTDLTDEYSVYLELASGSCVLAAISFLWLRVRRGGTKWLDKRTRRTRKR